MPATPGNSRLCALPSQKLGGELPIRSGASIGAAWVTRAIICNTVYATPSAIVAAMAGISSYIGPERK
jgi:hypothetical protein